jgi:glucans biosynthesis protein
MYSLISDIDHRKVIPNMSRQVITTSYTTFMPSGLLMLLLVVSTTWGQASPAPSANLPESTMGQRLDMLAQSLAEQPYDQPDMQLPPSLQRLDYDGYRRINFKRSQSISLNNPCGFRLEMFHRGYLFKGRVSLYLNDSLDPAEKLRYSPKHFDFRAGIPDGLTDDLDFAGLRLIYPMHAQPDACDPNSEAYLQSLDEVISFIGASYFRAVDFKGAYGSSARGLAVNTGMFDRAEEFPRFTRFWMLPDDVQDNRIRLWALLQSASVTGAYSFVVTVHPQAQITVDVTATLHLRKAIDKLGLAPLTSMFLYGESGAKATVHVDHRPEVHDADGLLIHSGQGEWLWRPLANPQEHRVTRFDANSPRGFGLIQRDKNIKHYKDLETNQHLRPSIWVEPKDDWGSGSVELLELSSTGEGMDNIGAYWIADKPIEVGKPLHLAYTLTFTHQPLPPHGAYQVQDSKLLIQADGSMHYTVTFTPTDWKQQQTHPLPQADFSTTQGKITAINITQNATDGTVTTQFDFTPENKTTAALRGFLHHGTDVISETWSDQCPTPVP